MDDKKTSKAKHGRHAAGSAPSSDIEAKPVEASSSAGAPAPGGGPQSTQPAAVPPRPAATTAGVPPYGAQPQAGYVAQGFVPASSLPSVDMGQQEAARSRKPLKILGIVLAVVVGLLLAAYVAGGVYFTGRFMPNTTLGDHDVSLKTASEVQGVLSEALEDYTVSVSGQGFAMKLSAKEAGIAVDGKDITDRMLAGTNPWMWPVEITRQHDETEKLAATYNESGLDAAVRTAVDAFNATATQPVSATVAFNEAVDAFTVQPEAIGTALDAGAIVESVDDAVVALEPTVKLTAKHLIKPAITSDNEGLKKAADTANLMIKADMQLTMAGTVAGSVDPARVASWIRLGDDLSVTLDDAALTAWVDELATACDTVGTQRTYTRPDGKVITVAGGAYGWSVDKDALLALVKDGVANGTTGTFDVPVSTSGTAYNGAGAQDWGARYCDIDLAEQYVRFYDASGALVWESACISGKPDGEHDTSVGVYWLNSKASPSKLTGYENGKKIYESTVQYWMPFVGNAIGLHDADWQPDFGGSMYRNGYGSHGCVNLPPAKAAELYGIIQIGDVVVSHW